MADVVEHRCQHRQQHHVDVVETGGAPGDRALDVAELPLLEVVYSLGEIVSREVEERQERRPHRLGTVLHNGSVRSRQMVVYHSSIYVIT